MPHTDPDVLALAALGEPVPADDRAHLAACPDCARELAALVTAAAVGRSAAGTRGLAAPDAVWERVRGELGLDAGLVPGEAEPLADPRGRPAAVPDGGAGSVSGVGPEASVRADGRPVAARPDHRRRAGLLVAAAAGLVVGGTVGALVVAGAVRSDDETVVAEASLEALPGWTAAGEATVEEAADGRRTLVLRLEGDEADGFREVWLLDRDVTGLVSLGVLDGDEGRFAIPPGLDLADFPVVDVSAEPFDGDPAHSGDSILRGELTTPA